MVNPGKALASDLIRKGFAVFPTIGKAPPKDFAGGFRNATRDPLTAERWWQEWPDAQVAIWPARCDPPLLVLDFDCKGGAPGLEALANLEIEGVLPPTLEAETPSGGRHLFYRLPPGAPAIGSRPLAPGVDVRSENGYVVWYGANGHALATTPPALLERLGEIQREPKPESREPACELDTPGQVMSAMRVAAALFREGSKDRYRKACRIKDEGVSPETCHRIMLGAGFREEGQTSLTEKIASAYHHGQNPPGAKVTERQQTITTMQAQLPKPEWTVASAAGFKPKRVEFMWHPYILAGHIAILGGRGGVGKGLVAAHVAAVISRGGQWPDGERAGQGRVLWCETEDPIEEALIPRLTAAGADLEMISFANPRLDFEAFAKLVRELKPALIVMSPLVSFLKGLADIRGELEVRAALEALQALLEQHKTALLGIGHLNKKPDLSGVERLLGSVAFANFVRSVMLIAPEPDHEDGTSRMAHAKHNLSVRGSDWCYRPIQTGEPRSQFIRLEWTAAPENVDTDTLFDKRKPGDDTALGWLLAYLQDAGEVDTKVLFKDALEAGHSKDAIKKARQRTRRVQVRWAVAQPGHPPSTLWFLT